MFPWGCLISNWVPMLEGRIYKRPLYYLNSMFRVPIKATLFVVISEKMWAATWQNKQNDSAPSEDSDQPGHPPSLNWFFAVHTKKSWILSYPMSAQQKFWSDRADAQADLRLRWAHSHFVGFVMSRLMSLLSDILIVIILVCVPSTSAWKPQPLPSKLPFFSCPKR